MAFSFPAKLNFDRKRSISQPVESKSPLQDFPVLAMSPSTPLDEKPSEPLGPFQTQVSFKESLEIFVDDLPSASSVVQSLRKPPNRQVNKKRNTSTVNRPQSLQLSFNTVDRNFQHRGSDEPRSI